MLKVQVEVLKIQGNGPLQEYKKGQPINEDALRLQLPYYDDFRKKLITGGYVAEEATSVKELMKKTKEQLLEICGTIEGLEFETDMNKETLCNLILDSKVKD
jgi:hypothetical protein